MAFDLRLWERPHVLAELRNQDPASYPTLFGGFAPAMEMLLRKAIVTDPARAWLLQLGEEKMRCQGPQCTIEIVQAPGGHRERHYCSDRCRMAAWRDRVWQAEQAVIRAAEEARIARERQAWRVRYPMLTDESLELLRQCQQQYGQGLVVQIGEALVREHKQAKANLDRLDQERRHVVSLAMRLGKRLGFPAVAELELEAGEPRWWVWLIDERNDLAQLARALNVTFDERSHAAPVTIGSGAAWQS